jgi:anti-sigma factor RsiW
MNCEKVSNSLIGYLDGRATAAERSMVEAHWKLCASCRERAEEFRRLWDVMSEAPAVEPSFAFDARVRQRIAAGRPRLGTWLMPSPRLAAAVVALVGLSVFVSVQPNKPISVGNSAANSEEQFRMIRDLGVLENYDVLSNFDALSDLPGAQPVANQPDQQKPDDPGTGNGES